MNIFKILGICFLTLAAQSASTSMASAFTGAHKSNPAVIPEFKGGLDPKGIQNCIQRYTEKCKIEEKPWLDTDCYERQMASDRSCSQASKLNSLFSANVSDIIRQGNVTSFTTQARVNGSPILAHMVDKQGELVNLESERVDLRGNKDYPSIKKKYGDILVGDLLWKDEAPVNQALPDGGQVLLFKQLLQRRSGSFSSCVGYVTLAYEYDGDGFYLGSKPRELRMALPNDERCSH